MFVYIRIKMAEEKARTLVLWIYIFFAIKTCIGTSQKKDLQIIIEVFIFFNGKTGQLNGTFYLYSYTPKNESKSSQPLHTQIT